MTFPEPVRFLEKTFKKWHANGKRPGSSRPLLDLVAIFEITPREQR